MNKQKLIDRGSLTAKNGFKNEDDIVNKFNNWQTDNEAKKWLNLMGYNLDEIQLVEAVKLHGYKTDIQVKITIYFKTAINKQNLSIKLVSNPQGFNQIDKRWVDKYAELWEIPDNVVKILKLFTGEIKPYKQNTKDKRRMFLNEMSEEEQNSLLKFVESNKILIVSDILKGRSDFSADWMLVALTIKGETKWVLKSINQVMNIFGNGEIKITPLGSLKIGLITVQRKGGDNGRATANMLQFKINPAILFNL